jgi:fatty acid desaturase
MADLSGLLSDLPGGEPAQEEGGRRHQRKMLKVQLERERLALRGEQRAHRQLERELRRRTLRWIPLLIALIVGAIVIAHTLTHSIGAWLVIGFIAFLWLRRNATGGHQGGD